VKTNHVLVDYENDPVKSLALLKGEQFRVTLFLGPHNAKLPIDLVLAMQDLGERARYVVLETPGKNALDFHVAYYLGVLAHQDPAAFFHIISKDTGFDPLIKHLKARNVLCARSASIEDMPCFKRPEPEAASPKMPAPAIAGKQESSKTATVDDMVKIAVVDLINRKASKPRTPNTLRSTVLATVQGKCGKGVSSGELESVYDALVKRGYVHVNGGKVSYTLPAV